MALAWNKAVSDTDGTIGDTLACGSEGNLLDQTTYDDRQAGVTLTKKVYLTSTAAVSDQTVGLPDVGFYQTYLIESSGDSQIAADLTGSERKYGGAMTVVSNTGTMATLNNDPNITLAVNDFILWWDAGGLVIKVQITYVQDNGNGTTSVWFPNSSGDVSGATTCLLLPVPLAASTPKSFWVQSIVPALSSFVNQQEIIPMLAISSGGNEQCNIVRAHIGQYSLVGAVKLSPGRVEEATLNNHGDNTPFYFTIPAGATIAVFVNANIKLLIYDASEVLYPYQMRAVKHAPYMRYERYIEIQNPSLTDAVTLYAVAVQQGGYDFYYDAGLFYPLHITQSIYWKRFNIVTALKDNVLRTDKGSALGVEDLEENIRDTSYLYDLMMGNAERTKRKWYIDRSQGGDSSSATHMRLGARLVGRFKLCMVWWDGSNKGYREYIFDAGYPGTNVTAFELINQMILGTDNANLAPLTGYEYLQLWTNSEIDSYKYELTLEQIGDAWDKVAVATNRWKSQVDQDGVVGDDGTIYVASWPLS